MQGRTKDGYIRFRMRFFPLWRAEMIVFALAAIAFAILGRWQFGRWELKAVPLAWPYLLAIAAFFAFFCVAFPTYAREDGLRAYDDHGRYLHVAWEDTDRIQSFWFLGVRVLRIAIEHEGNVAHVWVPCYLSKMRTFADFVAGHAGEDHPLAIKLARYRSRRDEFDAFRMHDDAAF